MDELKPCPFCGERLIYDIDDDGLPWINGDGYYMHPNNECILVGFQMYDEEEERTAWNRRVRNG